ncbi:hypothetical protein GW17_00052375, partial [Ensete ventricosum]
MVLFFSVFFFLPPSTETARNRPATVEIDRYRSTTRGPYRSVSDTVDWGSFHPVTTQNRSVTIDFDYRHPRKGNINLVATRETEEEGEETGEPRDPTPHSLDDIDPSWPSLVGYEEKTSPPPLPLVASDEEKTGFFSSSETTRRRRGRHHQGTYQDLQLCHIPPQGRKVSQSWSPRNRESSTDSKIRGEPSEDPTPNKMDRRGCDANGKRREGSPGELREEMRRKGVSSWGRIQRPMGAVEGGESLGFAPTGQAREGSAIRSEDLRISSPVS